MSIMQYFNLDSAPLPLAWKPSWAFPDAWFDPSDSNTVFQQHTGGLPALPGDPVGLVLDARKELGSELVTDTTWELTNAAWTNDNGTLTHVSGGAGVARQSISITAGKLYQVSFTAVVTHNNFTVRLGDTTPQASIYSSGDYSLFMVAAAKNSQISFGTSTTTGEYIISSISVREAVNPLLSQPTTAARPTLVRMPATGRRNLLAYTEDFNNAIWEAANMVRTGGFLAPDGSMGAYRLSAVATSTEAARTTTRISQGYNKQPFRSIDKNINSIYIKAGSYKFARLSLTTASNAGHSLTVNLETGEAITPSNNKNYSITDVGDGWYRISAGFTGVVALKCFALYLTSYAAGADVGASNPANTPQAGEYIYVYQPQFEEGEALTPYQKVTNDFDVTETGVPDVWSLELDGVDDVLNVVPPKAINGFILIAGTKGTIIEPVSYAAGSTLSIGPNSYTGGTAGILSAVGGIIGVNLFDRNLTELERDNLIAYYKKKGAKGLLVAGPELVVNGTFDTNLDGWTKGNGTTDPMSWEDGKLKLTNDVAYFGAVTQFITGSEVGRTYVYSTDYESSMGNPVPRLSWQDEPPTTTLRGVAGSTGQLKGVVTLSAVFRRLTLSHGTNLLGQVSYFDNVSVKELRAQEDWT